MGVKDAKLGLGTPSSSSAAPAPRGAGAPRSQDDVLPGYQRTEVGVIPENWGIKSLGMLGSVTAGGTPNRGTAQYWNGGIPWVTTTEIDFGVINEARQFISKDGLCNSAAKLLPPGTLLMALYGQGKTRGKVGVLGIAAAANQACAAISFNASVNRQFVLHYLASQYEEIRALSNTGNQENLNSSLVRSILVPLPGEAEQRAIAEALSDADALIESLQQLIAKQRALKRGAMQALLTGRQRLPGFTVEWREVAFGDIATRRRDRMDPRTAAPRDFCVELEHIASGAGQLVGHGATNVESSLKSMFVDGDVLFGKLRAYLRKYWHADRDGVCSTEIWCLLPNGVLHSSSLLFQIVQTDGFIEAASLAYGTHMPRSDWNAVRAYSLPLPVDMEEQSAIAAVLSDMDADIEALEASLAKSRALKAGMMQQLLTGRIRLV